MGSEIRGGAASNDGKAAIVWGEGVYRVDLRSGRSERLAVGSFRENGCVAEGGLVLVNDDRLVWLAGPKYDRLEVIDTGAEIADCLEATLLGRRGILVTWRGLQVRHYFPAQGERRWPYREIYSFYTASYQAGLLLRDVDDDGRPDLMCGNYWIQSPAEYDLPWRLFAINTYNDTPLAAKMRLAWLERNGAFPLLVAAQGALEQGRVTLFERPADPKQLWGERVLAAMPRPAAIAVTRRGLLVNGQLWNGSRFEPRQGFDGCLAVWESGRGTVCVTPKSVKILSLRKAGLRR